MKTVSLKFKTQFFLQLIGILLLSGIPSFAQSLEEKWNVAKMESRHNIILEFNKDSLIFNDFDKRLAISAYHVGGKRTKGQIDKAWEGQNKSVYKKHKPQNISGVGDRASWSDLGGGQLRVASDGNIFYVSFFVFPKNKDPRDTQEMIDKASTLTKKSIKKMN